MADIDYIAGFRAGKDFAREEILEYIQHHLEHQVDITSEEIATEIEYLQRQDIRKENG
jgi:hypothetical protein